MVFTIVVSQIVGFEEISASLKRQTPKQFETEALTTLYLCSGTGALVGARVGVKVGVNVRVTVGTAVGVLVGVDVLVGVRVGVKTCVGVFVGTTTPLKLRVRSSFVVTPALSVNEWLELVEQLTKVVPTFWHTPKL